MIKEIRYEDFLSPKSGKITVITGEGKEWEMTRKGISETTMKEIIEKNGKVEGIRLLMEEKKLIPVYGGVIDL